jgi:hypothetical protein
VWLAALDQGWMRDNTMDVLVCCSLRSVGSVCVGKAEKVDEQIDTTRSRQESSKCSAIENCSYPCPAPDLCDSHCRQMLSSLSIEGT